MTALVTTACAAEAPASSLPPLPEAVSLESPIGPASAEPNLSVAPDGRVLLSWIEAADSGHSLRFAAWSNSGWSAPRTIARGTDWFVNWADFPSLIQLRDGTLAAHWLQRNGEGTYAYGVRIARSVDGGHTWIVPVTPHRDESPAEHGFVSLYDAGDGAVGAVWLDGRQYAAGQEQMTLRHTTIAADGSLGRDTEIDARVCDCCQTSIARTSDGIAVFYRDRSDGEIRDIAAATLEGGAWSAPRRVHADEWHIEACPVNGPKADAQGNDVVLAWFTAPEDEPRVNVAFSTDGGRTFGAPVRVDDGLPAGRVDVVLLDDGTAVVSWLERVEGAAEIRLRRVAPAGTRSAFTTLTRTGAERASGFPRMARSGSTLVLAWTAPAAEGRAPAHDGRAAASQVHTARIELPALR